MATKKAPKKKMTGRFPSKEGFLTRCGRIVRRAGVAIDCDELFRKATGKGKKRKAAPKKKSSGKKRAKR